MRNTNKTLILLFFSFSLVLSSGCAKLSIRAVCSSVLPSLTKSLFQECDPKLAREAIPADLKIMEGLLEKDPGNKRLLTSLSMGFAGYALLFVEEDNPSRASRLYLRARDYGLRALGMESYAKEDKSDHSALMKALDELGKREIPSLFWTGIAWSGWVNLNLDKPSAVAQLSSAKGFLEKMVEISPEYFHGTPYAMMGTFLAAKPAMLGGNQKKAREYFEKAMAVTGRKFFLVHYYFARYYAVRSQDQALFTELLQEVEKARPEDLKEACLINSVMQEKCRRLLALSEEFFL